MKRAIYLHGFASGPGSSKGQFFRERFEKIGWRLELPDLTQGDFEHSTLSKQLAYVGTLVASEPALLLGSSMGGYLAALFAARQPERVPAVVLLAPAFGLLMDPAVMREWKERGWRAVYHYGEERERRISYELIADLQHHEQFPDVRQPALVIHGRNDEVVPCALSQRFAETRPNVELALYDSDHQLLNVLDLMWERVQAFAADQRG